eukprot:6670262-Pyramimonas_sp.AAC.1
MPQLLVLPHLSLDYVARARGETPSSSHNRGARRVGHARGAVQPPSSIARCRITPALPRLAATLYIAQLSSPRIALDVAAELLQYVGRLAAVTAGARSSQ